MTTALGQIITDSITTNGAMTVHDFMQWALIHPEHGYYTTQKAIGAEGDFITAPEISQMFGELCGLWCLDQLITQNIMDNAGWAELGPGRGTFMADIIRTSIAALQDTSRKWPVHLVDVNEGLIKEQKKKLVNITDLHHHESLNTLPDIPLAFLANEFFDALPVRQFEAWEGQWFEKTVMLENGSLCLAKHDEPETKLELPSPDENNQIAEYAPQLPIYVNSIANHINTYGGAALIIDYGKENALGNSLQAVHDHKPVDILENPGLCDISAWVDFNVIKASALRAGAKVFGAQSQGEFLKQLGLYQRAEQLAVGASPEERRDIAAAVDRLSSPAQMGKVFNVMAILPASHPAQSLDDLPGFALNS